MKVGTVIDDSTNSDRDHEGLRKTDATKTILAKPTDATRGRLSSSSLVWCLWLVNVAAFGAFIAWIFRDGTFPGTVHAMQVQFHSRFGTGMGAQGRELQLWPQISRFLLLGAVALCSAIGIFAGLFFGARTHRRIRSWLAFMVLVAAWLSLFGSWRELSWQGQIVRAKGLLSQFETVAASLRSDWPVADGERAEIGSFMAYPNDDPRVLLLLTAPAMPNTSTSFSAVERSQQGALRFELTGDEQGAWLEWHPEQDEPRGFEGGLQGQYKLERYAALGGGWFLVRYVGRTSSGQSGLEMSFINSTCESRKASLPLETAIPMFH